MEVSGQLYISGNIPRGILQWYPLDDRFSVDLDAVEI
jgi:hypothetical protein